jgi:hypothetical protein
MKKFYLGGNGEGVDWVWLMILWRGTGFRARRYGVDWGRKKSAEGSMISEV